MGMDVYGKAPANETGKYFRNNVWWWHPLWDYCGTVYTRCLHVRGHTNDGGGLGNKHSKELSRKLLAEIASGRTEAYRVAYDARIAALPRTRCEHCNGTGSRTDATGLDMGMNMKKCPDLDDDGKPHPRAGQPGWCNACNGIGTQAAWDSHYPFNVENVREFAEFLEHCGGFEIC